jgi:ATP-dependent DNA helicase
MVSLPSFLKTPTYILTFIIIIIFIVEHSLPKKKEYLLYAPLTMTQKNLYDTILKRNLREYLIKHKTSNDGLGNNGTLNLEGNRGMNQENTNAGDGKPTMRRRSTRALKSVNYKEASDKGFFKNKQTQDLDPITNSGNLETGRKHEIQVASKYSKQMYPQILMTLFLFF